MEELGYEDVQVRVGGWVYVAKDLGGWVRKAMRVAEKMEVWERETENPKG